MQGLVTFEQLMKFLKDNNVPHKANVELQIVGLPSKAAPLGEDLWIKWEKKVPFIQMIQHMIEDVPEDRYRDVEAAIARLNCALEIPGVTLDHGSHRISLRLAVPVFPPEGISPLTFHQLGQGCVSHAKEFYPALKAVVDGEKGENIVEIVQGLARAAKAKDDGSLA